MDILIDPYRASTPACFERLVMVKQTQTFGGTPVNDGFPQSGPAVTARSDFLAGLLSYVTADMDHVSASASTIYTSSSPITMWGGLGQLFGRAFTTFGTDLTISDGVTVDIGNGRFNTSANAQGNWALTASGWEISLTEARTAFGCYFTDIGDIREAEVEFRLYNGTTLVRIVAPPIIPIDKPRTNEAMWVGYANGSTPFTRIEAYIRLYSVNPSQRDYVGFDDFAVGNVITCTASALPTEFYGANTGSDAAKTVTGAALTARNSWAASAGTTSVCDFESMSVGSVASGASISFTGALGTIAATITAVQYSSLHAAADNVADLIDNNASSLRWNTTASGSKWYEWTDEVTIAFASARSGIGFYLTDLGNQNATLRVTLRRADGTGVSYYLPKASSLPAADSLLRFWGVTGEVPFTSVVLQTVYYSNLTADSYTNPLTHVVSPPDVVGIDDIMVA